jgi:hypothetical protein
MVLCCPTTSTNSAKKADRFENHLDLPDLIGFTNYLLLGRRKTEEEEEVEK